MNNHGNSLKNNKIFDNRDKISEIMVNNLVNKDNRGEIMVNKDGISNSRGSIMINKDEIMINRDEIMINRGNTDDKELRYGQHNTSSTAGIRDTMYKLAQFFMPITHYCPTLTVKMV